MLQHADRLRSGLHANTQTEISHAETQRRHLPKPLNAKNRPCETEAVTAIVSYIVVFSDLCKNWLRGPESTETCKFSLLMRSFFSELMSARVRC